MQATMRPAAALGAAPRGDPRACMFCGQGLADRGAAFVDHLGLAPGCRGAHAAWVERLAEDRPGG